MMAIDIGTARQRHTGHRRKHGSGGPPASGKWREQAIMKSNGVSWVNCLANAALVISNDPAFAGRIRYDAFRDQTIVRDMPWRTDEHAWCDEDVTELRMWLHRWENSYGLDVSKGDVDAAVVAVAHRNEFHPLRDWLSSLAWDGVARLDTLFPSYFGAEDTAYHRGIGARWAISAVARAFDPGCQVDYAPVLEGTQGLGKSTGLQTLVGAEWFFNSGIDLMNLKSAYETIQGKWIIELGELDALSKADLTRVKAFLTSQQDHYRAAYARHAVTRPRQVVFAGTTNEDKYLRDATGNRRFWPVRCSRIDRSALQMDREQLWAEAVSRYRAGEPWRPDDALKALAAGEQEDRYMADAWEEPVSQWVGSRDGVTVFEVLSHALAIDKGRISRGDEMRAAAILRRLGLTEIRRRTEGPARLRRYFRAVTPVLGANSAPTGVEGRASDGPRKAESLPEAPLPALPVQPIKEDQEEINTKSTRIGNPTSTSGWLDWLGGAVPEPDRTDDFADWYATMTGDGGDDDA